MDLAAGEAATVAVANSAAAVDHTQLAASDTPEERN